MANRITPDIAFKVVSTVADWVRQYKQDLNLTDVRNLSNLQHKQLNVETGCFWKTLRPLNDEFFSKLPGCAWWVAALRLRRATSRPKVSRDPFAFYPTARADLKATDGWKLSTIISELSQRSSTPPFETLLTSDLCINVLEDFTPFVIDRCKCQETDGRDPDCWHLYVGPLGVKINESIDIITPLLLDFLTADQTGKTLALSRLDGILKLFCTPQLRRLITLNHLPGKDEAYDKLSDSIFDNGSQKLLPLAKYIAIMTAICPQWQRIWMVPNPTPASDYVQPGGIVICEDGPEADAIIREEITHLSNISATAMWPWLGVNISDLSDSIDDIYHTPFEQLRGMRNDIRVHCESWERRGLALIDNGMSKCKPTQVALRRNMACKECPKTASVIIPVRGRRDELVKCLESIERQRFIATQGRKVELVIVQDGPEDGSAALVPYAETAEVLKALKRRGLTCKWFILQKQFGRSTARNIGLHHSTGEVVFFIDSTMVLANDFLTEHMMRHMDFDRIALLGFKENVKGDPKVQGSHYAKFVDEYEQKLKDDHRPNFSLDLKCHHELSDGEAFYTHGNVLRTKGECVNYMHELDWLKDISALEGAGPRNVPAFFMTGLVSVSGAALRETGGFLTDFDPNWGLEDTFMGAILLAKGVTLIPCPSSTAVMIQHEEKPDKNEQFETNLHVMHAYMHRSMMKNYSKQALTDYVTLVVGDNCVEAVVEGK